MLVRMFAIALHTVIQNLGNILFEPSNVASRAR